MVQVELAQLRYRLPRLRGRGLELSQQGGGIGTRGPGETQLEVDRRRIAAPDHEARTRPRAARRAPARRNARPGAGARCSRVALVGYTNAGKSTLLNRLTHADVLVEDRCSRRSIRPRAGCSSPAARPCCCSDTVGFVRRLPHQLVEAFRSTLEEVVDADLLVHVVDGSATDADSQIEAVRARARRDRRGRRARAARREQDRRRPAGSDRLVARRASRARSRCRPRTGEGIEKLRRPDRRAAARAGPHRRAASCPTTAATCSPRCTATARCSSRCTPTRARACGPASPTGSSPGSSAFIVTDTE